MKYRLAGSLSVWACCLFGFLTHASAQDYYGGPNMPAWSPAWSMPPGSMPPGMMQGQGMPPGLMGGSMPPGMMAQQAGFEDGGPGYAQQAPMDQAHPDGGYGPGGPSCTDGCQGCAACSGSTRAGLMKRGLLKGKCANGACGPMGGGGGIMGGDGFGGNGPFSHDGWGEGGGGLLGNSVGFRWMRFLLPEDDGGACAVRWFDVAVDYLYYTRDDTGGDRVFARRGQGGTAPFALGTSQLDFDHEPGFRVLANIQWGSANSIEFGYFGSFSHATFAQAVSPQDNLFSVMSNFGNSPAGGFEETDFSRRQRLEYSSDLDNFEANYRTRWMSPECRYQGSWLIGARYICFNDDLLYQTIGQRGARMDYFTNTNNSLTGLQLGGDLWMCLLPGLRIGVEGKAGIFGNYSRAGAIINTGLPFHYREDSQSSDAAFVGELNVNMLYRLNYNWTLRMGYNFLVMEGVALATDNFNATPPNAFAQNLAPNQIRQPTISNNGDVLFHGMNVGLEYMW